MIDVTSGRKSKSKLKIDLLKSFGADFQLGIRSPLHFIGESGNAVIYPVGHHLAIRDIFGKEDLRKNDIMFIYNDDDMNKITSMNTTRDYNLFLTCETKSRSAIISIYNLSKLNFKSIMIFKAMRRIESTIYKEFIFASCTRDGNCIASIGKLRENEDLHGIIWDVQIYQTLKPENYKPKCVFPLPKGTNKISIFGKIICTSGNQHLSFWYLHENSIKEFKGEVKNLDISSCNFVDHEWINLKLPTLAVITEQKELYILEGFSENKNFYNKMMSGNVADFNDEENSAFTLMVDSFIIKQHLNNIFNEDNVIPNIIKSFDTGIVVGSDKGYLLFLEKIASNESTTFKPIRTTKRDKSYPVTGLSINKSQNYIAVSYSSNEIAYFNITNIFESLKAVNFELRMSLVCDGFHQGPITAMDISLQRPLIITASSHDKSIRIWNFLTGHCEYCKIVLSEKEKNHEKEMDILAVAMHPNGYYVAVSDKEMIRFFHLCYKELRYYNNELAQNEISHTDCHILKFSYGGHLLAAVSGRQLYIIKSYTRETLKLFDTPHTSRIESVFFHDQDHYVYTVGSDGMIIEYNLFNFHHEKISSKIITYFSGCYSFLNKSQFVLVAVGQEGSETNVINEVLCTEIENMGFLSNDKKGQNNEYDPEINNFGNNNTRNNENFSTKIKENLSSICNIKSKRYDIGAYATGNNNGVMSLYPNLLFLDSKGVQNAKIAHPWASVKSHRGRITHINFNKDTNLLFSAGEDGNLFVYCVHELQDGENLSYENTTTMNMNQITSILDEGLGDNVLYPLNAIFLREDEIHNQNNVIEEYKNQEEKLKSEQAMKLRERGIELNDALVKETNKLKEELRVEILDKDNIIEKYKTKIKNLENEQRQILIDKEKQYTERIDQMSNTIHDLNSRIYSLKSEHEIDLKKKDESFEKKFKEIDKELRKEFEKIKNENEKLTNDLKNRQKMEEYRFIHLDREHEQEINDKNAEFENVINSLDKERVINQGEISSLTNDKKKLDNELKICSKELEKRDEEIKRHIDTILSLRKEHEKKEVEIEKTKKTKKEIESQLQEKSKLEQFNSKLKNELYIKNVEIMSKFNKQQNENSELKKISKNTEKQLDNNIKLLNDKKEEVTKKENQLEEYKNKYEKERHNVKLLEKDLDNLLQKIYDTFQTNDKNIILKNIKKIYNTYITEEQIRKINNAKLNENIKDELTKQIDFLQKGILSIADQKAKREANQNSEIYKKTKENAELIKHLNIKKKAYTILEKDFFITKSDLSAKIKKYEQLERERNNLTKANAQLVNNIKMNNLPDIGEDVLKRSMSTSKKYNFNSNIFSMKQDDGYKTMNGFNISMRKSTDKQKNWKDTKLYKGNTLSFFKKNRENIYKMKEIKKLLDEKNSIIRKQNNEITNLKNALLSKESQLYAKY